MTLVLPPGITDRRHEFAQRFHAVAGSSSVASLPRDPFHQGFSGAAGAAHGGASLPLAKEGSPHITLVVPGLLADSFRALVAPFLCAREWLEESGYDVRVAWLNGRRGAAHNGKLLRDQVLRASDESGLPVHLIGYSKGCADAMEMLGTHGDVHGAVRSLVGLAGVVRGTPLATVHRPLAHWALRYLPLPGLGFGDGLALRDLSYSVRLEWLANHVLPPTIRYGSILAVPSPERVSRILKGGWKRLAEIDPRNDSQVLAPDSLIPGSELLGVLDADHWAVALPIEERLPWVARIFVTQNEFPRRILLRTIIDHMDAAPTKSGS